MTTKAELESEIEALKLEIEALNRKKIGSEKTNIIFACMIFIFIVQAFFLAMDWSSPLTGPLVWLLIGMTALGLASQVLSTRNQSGNEEAKTALEKGSN